MKVMMPGTDSASNFQQQTNPVSNVLVGTGELWAPYRDIQDLVERTCIDASPQNFSELEEALKLHKPDFISLLSTKPRSPADREELKKGATEGIYLRGHDTKKVLQASIIQESIIISDMFDINEFQALDLLTIAQIEQECHPGWGRGLLAVFMFYEGRAALVSSFVSILQAIPGFTWVSRVPKKVVDLFQSFLNQVFQDDMIDRLLGLLTKNKVKPQIEMLETNLALGDWRHRATVTRFIEKIREGLAQIIFCWSAQRGLSWKDALRILEYLKTNLVLTDEFELDKEDILLITSLLYAVDHSLSSTAAPNRSFAVQMKKYCTENDFANGFQCVEILDLLKLTYFTNTYKLINETHITSVQNVASYQVDSTLAADINEDDDFEFRKDLCNFLKSFIFSKRELFATEEHVFRRYHLFFVDFITYLPLKVKDLKNRCEDAAKTIHLYNEQGLVQPPNLPQDYENFLECLSLFYSEDSYGLASDYFSNEIQFAYLNKLVRSATVDYPFMFIHNVRMLTGLARGCPQGVFNMLKQNGHYLSLEHFFDSVMKYLTSFGNQVSFNGPSIYTSDTYQRVVLDSMKLTVNPAEIQGICVYLNLIEVLCNNSDAVKYYFTTTKSQWLKVAITAAKVRSIPREIRARMLSAASAMISKDSVGLETSMNLWEMFYNTKLIDYGSGDLRDELEDKEARLESYSLTIGLLKLLDSLIEARFGAQDVSPLEINLNSQIDNGVLQPYVSFVRDAVLLKVGYRSYKSIIERWELATLALGIVSKLLDYVPALMLQMLSDSPLHRMCLGALVDCMRLKEMSIGWAPHVDKCSLQCLSLIQRVLQRQHTFLFRRELSSGKGTVVVGLHQLLLVVLPDSGKPDYLLAIVKFIDLMYPESHRHIALDILSMIISGHGETDSHVYSAIISEPTVAAILRQTLCELLDDPNTEDDVKKLILKLMRSSIIHASPNLALYFLGADKKVDFQNPGIQNYPRTLLHAVLDNATATPDSFLTLLMFMRDSRLASSLLRYLRTNQYFVKILMKEFPSPQMQFDCVGHFLKCVALELNNTRQPGPLAHLLVGQERGKFQDILERIEMQLQSLDIPNLEFFDPSLVIQAMKSCEYVDRELNTKIVRLDVLESLLREEIHKLEKSTVLRLRKSVHVEAKELLEFTKSLNAARKREALKVLMFDGWKQCLEILLLNPAALKLAGADFVTSILLLILDKVRSTVGPSEYFLRLAAETTLTLCAVINKLHPEVKGSTLNVILNHLCAWVPEEEHSVVRTYLYGSIHYVVDMIRDLMGATTNHTSFSHIIDHLCRDVAQSSDFGRLQAMYLVGEIIRWTHSRNLGGHEIKMSSPGLTTTNGSRFAKSTYASPFRETVPPKILIPSGRARTISSPTQTFFDSKSMSVTKDVRKSFIETITPKRQIEPKQLIFPYSPSISSSIYSPKGAGLVSSTPKSTSFGGRRSRTENIENGSESTDDEHEEEPRRKSLLDCTSQDIFDPSSTTYGKEKDETYGKITTMKKLSLGTTPIKKTMVESLSSFTSSQSTLITHLHTKGYLRGLVDALPLVDDPLLIQLFSSSLSAVHMRALLIFEGKMSLFCRIAWAGAQPTLYLVDVNAILRLADMSVFDINFVDDESELFNSASMMMDQTGGGLSETVGQMSLPTRITRMEILFSSVLKFFLSMVTSVPKNILIVDQIWHFIMVHDASLANLISSTVLHQEDYRASAYFFTALMAKIARKLPVDAYKKKSLTYLRLLGILKLQAVENISNEVRLMLVRNALLFLFNYALNTEAAKEEISKKNSQPCRAVLTPQFDLTNTAGNLDDEISIGLILKLVRDSLNRIHVPNTIPTAKAMNCHASIVEIGLTLSYYHAEMYIRDSISEVPEERTSTFQEEFRSVVEEYFAVDMAIHKETLRGNYTETMLHRIRRLAHMP